MKLEAEYDRRVKENQKQEDLTVRCVNVLLASPSLDKSHIHANEATLIIAFHQIKSPICLHLTIASTLYLTIRWDKSLGGRRIALFHFPPKDESLLRLVVGDELQLRLDAAAARLYGECRADLSLT